MDKTEYMNRLKTAMQQFPGPQQEQVLWEFEHQFIKAMMAGQSEQEIAASLPLPELVAVDFRSQQQPPLQAPATGRTAGVCKRVWRGLLIVLATAASNLLLLGPALLAISLLAGSALLNIGLYASGIGLSAASLNGSDSFWLIVPGSHQSASQHYSGRSTSAIPLQVEINERGIQVTEQSHNNRIVSSVPAAAESPEADEQLSNKMEFALPGHFTGSRGFWYGCSLIIAALLLMVMNCYLLGWLRQLFQSYWRWQWRLLSSLADSRTA